MGEGKYIAVVFGPWDVIVDGAVLVFVVDGGKLGVGLFDTLGYFAHGKNMTKFYLLFVVKKGYKLGTIWNWFVVFNCITSFSYQYQK